MIKAPSDLNVSVHSKLPICGVVTTAVVCNISVQDAWNYYKKFKRDNWKGILPLDSIITAINNLGAKVTKENKLTKSYYKVMLKDFVHHNWINGDNNVYMVINRDHIQVVQGRNAIDQGGLKDISNYRWARKKIVEIYRVDSLPKMMDTDIIKNKDTYNKEIEVVTKKVSKFSRAKVIVRESLDNSMSRKDILAKLTDDLETTWSTASTMYHKILKEIKAETV